MYPEHTSIAYEKAVEQASTQITDESKHLGQLWIYTLQGADFVECDVTITKDLVLICSHEPWISEVSNAEETFADRTATYDMDDADPSINWNDKGNVTDIYAIDLTLEEIRTLRRKQVGIPCPNFLAHLILFCLQANERRDPKYDLEYGFVTFAEHLEMAKELGFGVIPEIKQAYATNKVRHKVGNSTIMNRIEIHSRYWLSVVFKIPSRK